MGVIDMGGEDLEFTGWRLAREDGSPWRRVVDVERGDEHLGEAEVCLTSAAAAGLAEDLGRQPATEEIADALMAYAEDRLRSLVAEGEDLRDHGLILEIDSADRAVLLPYLQR